MQSQNSNVDDNELYQPLWPSDISRNGAMLDAILMVENTRKKEEKKKELERTRGIWERRAPTAGATSVSDDVIISPIRQPDGSHMRHFSVPQGSRMD